MNKVEAMRRMSDLKKIICEAVQELEELRVKTYGIAARGRPGSLVQITFKDGEVRTYLSIAAAVRALRARLGGLAVRRGGREDLYRLVGRLGAAVEIDRTEEKDELEGD